MATASQGFTYIGCVSTSPDAFAIAGECLCDDPESGVSVEYVVVNEANCDAECIYGEADEGFCGGGGVDGAPQVYSLYKAEVVPQPVVYFQSSSNSTAHWTTSNSTASRATDSSNPTAIITPPPYETSLGGEHGAVATPPVCQGEGCGGATGTCVDSTCEHIIVSGSSQVFASRMFSAVAAVGVVLRYAIL